MTNLTTNHKKTRITLIVSTLLACFAAQSRSQQTSNLVQDPGFEASSSPAPHWIAEGNPTAFGVDTTAAHAHSGNNSAFMSDDYSSGTRVYMGQTVKVAADTSYTLTAFVDASNTTGGVLGVGTSGGTIIGTTAFVNTDPGPFTHGGSDYQPYTVKFNSGSNTSLVVFAGYTTPGGGSFINLDDVSLLSSSGSTPPAKPSTSQTIFNCSSFTSSTGSCSVATGRSSSFTLNGNGPPSVSGPNVLLMPTGAQHQADSIIWNSSAVDVHAFSSTFTFIPNGWNLAFVLQNNTNIYAGPEGPAFSAGAGCEAGFYQAFDANDTPPTNIFALELDSQSYLNSSNTFTYSSAQIYQQGQSPCNPNDNNPNYYITDKISTSPVPLTSPANSLGSTTGDTYSATLNYDGNNVVLNMYDITAGGSCPGSSCFTHTWTGVNIPSLVNGNTAWVGLTSATNQASTRPLYIKSFTYGTQ
jgi:hypothetical protein